MNYQHAYHAGCVADLFKHIVLIQLLLSLHKKPAAFTYIDTHAGKSIYNLLSDPAQKTKEYQQGILKLWNTQFSDSAILEYVNCIKFFNTDGTLKNYPGSSIIAKHYLRAQDEMILCELSEAPYRDLFNYFYHDKQTHIHQRNGYEALLALIPPKTQRGLVLMDPPYEDKQEFSQITQTLEKALKRWATGIYAVWFPIKNYANILEWYHGLKQLSSKKILTAEFWTNEIDNNTLKGSGLVFINPPWQFDLALKNIMSNLARALQLNNGNHILQWLNNKE